ncbi:MAG: hypothetical protein EBS05_13450, partial [Proteobacteria bacterium]|nr:hypothetical protein [Pseudomonadota bacterium]
DDGYNRVNTPGNPALGPGGTPVTTYFGYQNVSQVANVVGAGTLTEHSVQLNGGDYNRSMKNQAFPGLEFAYQYDWKSGKDWRLSWDASVGYQWFNWSHRDAPNSTANVITDVYQLNGVNLPGASYDGSPTPSPFTATIGSTPTRTDATALASVTGSRQLGLHALQLRLAPAVEWAPTPDWLLGASAGVTLGLGFTELSYAETINTVDGAGNPLSISQSGRSTATHVWAGLSTAVRVTRHLGEHWDVQLEARHLLVDPIHHNAPVRSGEIHLSDGLSLAAALSYRF